MMSWCSLVDGRLYCDLKVMLSTFTLEQKTTTVAFANSY